MVTDTLRGCTVSCTHCSRSAAKRWGSAARSQASRREQLRAEAWGGLGREASGAPGPPCTPSGPRKLGSCHSAGHGSRAPRLPARPPGPLPPPRPVRTHVLCRTHQPQWGSRDPRHSSHDVYCTQLSTGTRVTCTRGLGVRSLRARPCAPHTREPPSQAFLLLRLSKGQSWVTLTRPSHAKQAGPVSRERVGVGDSSGQFLSLSCTPSFPGEPWALQPQS